MKWCQSNTTTTKYSAPRTVPTPALSPRGDQSTKGSLASDPSGNRRASYPRSTSRAVLSTRRAQLWSRTNHLAIGLAGLKEGRCQRTREWPERSKILSSMSKEVSSKRAILEENSMRMMTLAWIACSLQGLRIACSNLRLTWNRWSRWRHSVKRWRPSSNTTKTQYKSSGNKTKKWMLSNKRTRD